MVVKYCLVAGAACFSTMVAFCQDQPIAYVKTDGVTISGSLQVVNGRATIGNDGSITAGDKTANVVLVRGGDLRLCASTTVHITRDRSVTPATGEDSTALMLALDRGALEASYKTGPYSDVLLTPDLRILVSGPGDADLKMRVNQKGDTCFDNHGDSAPYVTVTSQFEGGVYRIKPNQRVLFEHGSLEQVVDNETEPCGCPPSIPINVASNDNKPVGGPSSTPADTAFPLAVSEGLKPPPPPPSQPVVPAGTPHAQVEVPLTYNGAAPTQPSEAPPVTPPEPEVAASQAPTPPAPPTATPAQKPAKSGGLFHHIGHFFAKLFGAG
ncbi:nuclease [Alloacidobacterium dinghuense]|uniref:Nuclease n=1 Tax=Alloacidobacterium dinghuense TaxID=2763107 RepID=A0A7G8BCZ8_9BACT|nr:nuclease [Alloacidobacterium dinghuense]QNI30418.1 nuclease [Alloacidobacterium dinghuense]